MSTEQNKALVRHVLAEVWRDNFAILDDHPGMHESIAYLKQLAEAVDFSQRDIVQQVADGEWVVTRLVGVGTNAKDFMGMPAGTQAQMETIIMQRIENGKIVEQYGQSGRIG